jgi:hypothetical protein
MKKFLLLFLSVICFLPGESLWAGPWTQKASLPGPGRHRGFAFTIGSRAYVGAGWNSSQVFGDFWEYDPGTNSWTQKAALPSGPDIPALSFSVGARGYYIDQMLNFWEYNPANNLWSYKGAYPGWGSWNVEGFSSGTKGYAGEPGTNDLYIYDQPSDTWTSVFASYTFDFDVVIVALSGKGYWITGSGNQLWSYNIAGNAWTQLPSMPPAAGMRTEASGFAVGGKIYVGIGQSLFTGERLGDFWEFNPANNQWKKVDDFDGFVRDDAVHFTLASRGYICTGTNGNNMQDLWEFNPALITDVSEPEEENFSVSVFPNPMQQSATLEILSFAQNEKLVFELYDLQGKCVRQFAITDPQSVIHRGNLSAGIFVYQVTNGTKTLATGKLVIQ